MMMKKWVVGYCEIITPPDIVKLLVDADPKLPSGMERNL